MAKKHHNRDSSEQGELRLIGGKWRSRKLTFPLVDGLRPSPSRIRETLFNWLGSDILVSDCLDLFAGSGALGFEALSRGAKSVTMVELNKQVIRQLQVNQSVLKAEQLTLLNQDATKLDTIKGYFDFVFCDPPFNQNFVQPLLLQLQQSNLLNDNALVYVETEKTLINLDLPKDWVITKEKVAGDVRYRLISTDKYQNDDF